MDISLERQSGNLRPEDVYWYYDAKRRRTGAYDRETTLSHVRRELCESDTGPLVYERVPREVVKYADTSELYRIKRTEFDEESYTFQYSPIHRISRILYWGGYNATLSDEEFRGDPLKEVKNGPAFLCQYALSKEYGIRLTG